jgi:hypothetical protein
MSGYGPKKRPILLIVAVVMTKKETATGAANSRNGRQNRKTRVMTRLLFCSAWTSTRPLRWKGGMARPALGGPPTKCATFFRGIRNPWTSAALTTTTPVSGQPGGPTRRKCASRYAFERTRNPQPPLGSRWPGWYRHEAQGWGQQASTPASSWAARSAAGGGIGCAGVPLRITRRRHDQLRRLNLLVAPTPPSACGALAEPQS